MENARVAMDDGLSPESISPGAIQSARVYAFLLDLHGRSELAHAMEQLSETMGTEQRDKAIAEGRLIGLDDAVQIALGEKTYDESGSFDISL